MAFPARQTPLDQPGLEVAPEQPWLEARSFYESDAKEAVLVSKYTPDPDYAYAPPPPVPPPKSQEEPGRRKRLLILGILVASVVVLAAVLGGVLGSRGRNSGSSSGEQEGLKKGDKDLDVPATTTGTGTSTPTASARPQTIRQGSSLSVTGWRNTDGVVEKYLFFQDPQDGLRLTHCAPLKDGNEDCWQPPTTFNAFAKPDARLSASILIYRTQHAVCLGVSPLQRHRRVLMLMLSPAPS